MSRDNSEFYFSEKKHEPMFVQTQHTPLPEALQTWSPYRAADQVALISMPHSMVSVYISLDICTYMYMESLQSFKIWKLQTVW